ncbi:MAG: hypothetical protein DDT26_00760 [Dehalococcoidia bacterium]|nr:hypothetical protein [Chloroflexota bacterium]
MPGNLKKFVTEYASIQTARAAIDPDPDYPWRDGRGPAGGDRDDFFWTPQPLAEFVRSSMGASFYPNQLADFERFFPSDPKEVFADTTDRDRYTEALLHWGKGAGKDFSVSLVVTWLIHILLCVKNPQQYLGQARNENLDIVVVGYNQNQSRDVFFFKFKQRIRSNTWIREAITRLRPDVGGDRWLREGQGYMGAESLKLPLNLFVWSVPSTPNSFEGKNLIAWVCDELAAFASPTRLNNAKQIHDICVSSARTRFGNRWKGFSITYPRHKGDYSMQLADQIEAGLITSILYSRRSTWEVNPRVDRESFAEDYRKDPEGSACRYECLPPAAVDAYFRSSELLTLNAHGCPLEIVQRYAQGDEAIAIARRGVSPIAEVDQYNDPVLNAFGFPKLHKWFRGVSGCEYFCHGDPGLSGDAYGFAIGHIKYGSDGSAALFIDLAFRWTGAMFRDFGRIQRRNDTSEIVTAAEVDFRTVREFIAYLRQVRQFEIALCTFDRWNSAESIQELRKADVPTRDRIVNKEDYDEFKALVYSNRLHYYGYPILIRECEKLQIISGNKIEAPRTAEGEKTDSHKDVADAVAAVCRHLVHNLPVGIQIAEFKAPEIPQITERVARNEVATSRAQQRLLDLFLSADD